MAAPSSFTAGKQIYSFSAKCVSTEIKSSLGYSATPSEGLTKDVETYLLDVMKSFELRCAPFIGCMEAVECGE